MFGKALIYMLAGMGVAAVVGFFISRKKKKGEQGRRAQQAGAAHGANIRNDITQVKAGGVLELPNFGPGVSPGTFETYVKHRNRYSDSDTSWYELVCEYQGRELLVEWSKEGRQTYISAGFEDNNPKLADLGLTEEDLIEFDEGRRKSFEWDGLEWFLQESCERKFYEEDGSDFEGHYAWDFEDEEGDHYITIEKYASDHRMYVYRQYDIPSSSVNVYDVGQG